MSEKAKQVLGMVLLTVFAVGAVIAGMLYTTKNAKLFTGKESSSGETYLARVDCILSAEETENSLMGERIIHTTTIRFTCTVLRGEKKGTTKVAVQTYDDMSGRTGIPVEPGDRLYIYSVMGKEELIAGNLYRFRQLLVLFCALIVILVIFAGKKSIATMVSLGLTIASVFFVFVPAILSGFNIYLWTMIVCAYSILITPPFIGGFNRKSTASIIGCIAGIGVASLVTVLMNYTMKITGFTDEEDMYVTLLLDDPIDLRAITFAAIIIGALGSTMDVSMSIATSVWEMKEQSGRSEFGFLLRSGINIGRDIMGTQISTLVLAYIGSTLCTVLLYVSYQASMMEMINVEAVSIQIFDALIGAATIVITIPLTAIVSALLFSKEEKRTLISEKKKPRREVKRTLGSGV